MNPRCCRSVAWQILEDVGVVTYSLTMWNVSGFQLAHFQQTQEILSRKPPAPRMAIGVRRTSEKEVLRNFLVVFVIWRRRPRPRLEELQGPSLVFQHHQQFPAGVRGFKGHISERSVRDALLIAMKEPLGVLQGV